MQSLQDEYYYMIIYFTVVGVVSFDVTALVAQLILRHAILSSATLILWSAVAQW